MRDSSTMRRRPYAAAVLAAVAIAGCGGASNKPATDRTLLGRTLGAIGYSAEMGGSFTFGDLAALRALTGAPASYATYSAHPPPANRWSPLLTFGTDYFQNDPAGVKDGLDVLTGDVALMIGEGAHEGGMLSGPRVDTARFEAAMEKLGAKPGKVAGRQGLVWGPPNESHPTASTANGAGPTIGFDRILVDSHKVLATNDDLDMRELLGGGRTLAADPAMAATIACLGDVIAATGVGLQSAGGPLEVAAGVLRPANESAPAREVICEIPPVSRLKITQRDMESRLLTPGQVRASQRFAPEGSITQPTVTTGTIEGRGWVRGTATDEPKSRAGVFLAVLIQRLSRGSVLQAPTP